jgi:predicted metal-dependent phosphotriesterase family hydrolase
MRFARTVLGDVTPAKLGRTLCHEHLLTAPGGRFAEDKDLLLDDPARSATALETFRSAGGGTLVEVTTPEFGRSSSGLRALSLRTGVHLVATTGHVSEDYWRGVIDLDAASERSIAEEMLSDLTESMDEGEVRAGVIKVGSSLDRITTTEAKVMRAAAAAQAETGAPITTHTSAGTAAMDQIRVLEKAGVDPARVCIGHLDRRLVWREHLEVARAGAFLGYDCISKEHYEPDTGRARFIARLLAAGHGEQICLSGDLARRSYLDAWGGGPGYRYILEDFVSLLGAAGLDPGAVDLLLIDNPARLLTWHPPRDAT